jgi:hypothetical protein
MNFLVVLAAELFSKEKQIVAVLRSIAAYQLSRPLNKPTHVHTSGLNPFLCLPIKTSSRFAKGSHSPASRPTRN